MYTDDTDELTLIKLAQTGDADAETALIIMYRDLVKAVTRPFYLAGADREDLLQIGTIGLINAVRGFNAQGGASFKTFASRCVKNTVLNAIKKHDPKKEPALLDEFYDGLQLADGFQANPETDFIEKETATLLREAISQELNPIETTVLNLYMDSTMSYEEISKQLGLEKKKVDNTIYSAKKKIKKLLSAKNKV